MRDVSREQRFVFGAPSGRLENHRCSKKVGFTVFETHRLVEVHRNVVEVCRQMSRLCNNQNTNDHLINDQIELEFQDRDHMIIGLMQTFSSYP